MLILWIAKSLQETNHLPLLMAARNQGANPRKKVQNERDILE
jgi:hypothetical protein